MAFADYQAASPAGARPNPRLAEPPDDAAVPLPVGLDSQRSRLRPGLAGSGSRTAAEEGRGALPGRRRRSERPPRRRAMRPSLAERLDHQARRGGARILLLPRDQPAITDRVRLEAAGDDEVGV